MLFVFGFKPEPEPPQMSHLILTPNLGKNNLGQPKIKSLKNKKKINNH